jgi:diguanylate cyclase
MDTRPWRALRRFFLYAGTTFVPVLGLGIVLSVSYAHEIDQAALEDGHSLVHAIGDAGIEPFLEGHPLSEGLNARERYSLMMSTGNLLSEGTVLSLRVRDGYGRVMFDAENPTAPPGDPVVDDEVLEVIAGGSVVGRATVGNDSADAADGDGEPGDNDGVAAIESYVALYSEASPDRPVGALEVYLPYAPIELVRADSLRRVQLMLVAGLAVLWIALALVVWSVTRRIHRQSERHEHLALHDALTGLPNRALYADRVQTALAAARRTGTDVGLAIVDLDRFKEVNDSLGHQNGDEFLRLVAQRMAASIRPGDTLARLGGDEFGIVLPGASNDTIELILRRVQDMLGEETELAGVPVSAEASIGYAIWPVDADDAEMLLQRADLALYTAKEARAAIVRYHEGIDEFDPQRLGLVSELKRAIGAGDLVLHYQPKIDMRTGRVVAFEALVRWEHPTRGTLQPNEFIPVAESTGLITPLTKWVVEAALKQLASWSTTSPVGPLVPDLAIAVNISARNLREEQLATWIFERLDEYGIAPHRLVLEITETSFATDPIRATHLLETLSAGGVQVSLDDFGQGYTSLGSLGRLPVSELKIDRGFIWAMEGSAEDRAIVASVIELGHQLGLSVVAEGVETEAMLDDLRLLGCDTVQGFLFSPPVPANKALGLMGSAPVLT